MKSSPSQSASKASNYQNAGCLSKFSYYFLWPLAQRSRNQLDELELKELENFYSFQEDPNCSSKQREKVEPNCDQLERNWLKQLEFENEKEPNLGKALFETFGLKFLLIGLLVLLNDCLLEPLYYYYCVKLVYLIDHYPATVYEEEISQTRSMLIKHHSMNITSDSNHTQPEAAPSELVSGELKVSLSSSLNNLLIEYYNLLNYDNQLMLTSLAYVMAGSLVLLLVQPYSWRISKLSFKIRNSLSKLIYKKIFRCDSSVQNGYRQSLNLIAKDLQDTFNISSLVYFLTGPLESFAVSCLLVNNLGYSTSFLMFALANFMVIQRFLIKSLMESSSGEKEMEENLHGIVCKKQSLNDLRSNLLIESLASIRNFRLCSWLDLKRKQLNSLRAHELGEKKWGSLFLIAFDSFIFLAGYSLIAMIILLYGHYVAQVRWSRAKATQMLMALTIQRRCMGKQFLASIDNFQGLKNILTRCQEYLLQPEVIEFKPTSASGKCLKKQLNYSSQNYNRFLSPPNLNFNLNLANSTLGKGLNLNRNSQQLSQLLSLNKISSGWLQSCETCLENINLQANLNERILIIGPTGSGKSSLLQTILGELNVTSGWISLNGRVSYYSGEANQLLPNSTIRDNILFFNQMDRARYEEVLNCCLLARQLERLPQSDQTKLCSNLSQNLKRRILLARCLYERADVYLLDEPICGSDLDSNRQLFQRILKGFLRDKLVLMAASRPEEFLDEADKLLILYKRNDSSFTSEFGTIKEILFSKQRHLFKLDRIMDRLELIDSNKSVAEAAAVDRESKLDENPPNSWRESGEIKGKSILFDFDHEFNKQLTSGHSVKLQGLKSLFANNYFQQNGNNSRQAHEREKFLFEMRQLAGTGASRGEQVQVFGQVKTRLNWLIFLSTSCLASLLTILIIIWSNAFANVRDKGYSPFEVLEFLLSLNFKEFSLVLICLWLILTLISLIRAHNFMQLYQLNLKQIYQLLIGKICSTKLINFDKISMGPFMLIAISDFNYLDSKYYSTMDDLSLQSIIGLLMLVIILISQIKLILNVIFISLILFALYQLFEQLINSVKILNGFRRSDLLMHLMLTLNNLTSFRASDKEAKLIEQFELIQNQLTSLWFIQLSIKNCLMDILNCCLVSFLITLATFNYVDTINYQSTYAFVGINFIIGLTRSVQSTAAGYLEYRINLCESIKRVQEFCQLEPEEAGKREKESSQGFGTKQETEAVGFFDSVLIESKRDIVASKRQRKTTQSIIHKGSLKFIGVSLKYPSVDELDEEAESRIALKNLSFKIDPGEKVAIVGNCGAGKSSLVSILFRLYDFEGFVYVDNKDIKRLDLNALRNSISIIPEEPSLSSGSLRFNLDPNDEFPDELIWSALEAVELKEFVLRSKGKSLMTRVEANGRNFSRGQRQLICLARAILEARKLVIFDELTAALDHETSQLVQQVIRSKFKDSTVITIGARLSEALAASLNRVLVLDGGQVREFGEPSQLLKSGGLFAKLSGSPQAGAGGVTAR